MSQGYAVKCTAKQLETNAIVKLIKRIRSVFKGQLTITTDGDVQNRIYVRYMKWEQADVQEFGCSEDEVGNLVFADYCFPKFRLDIR